MTAAATATEASLSRRRWLRNGLWGLGALVAGTGYYAWRVEPHWFELVERALPIVGLPAALHGKTLVQISDLHIGPVVDSQYLIGAFKFVAKLEPDILVCTGDWIHQEGDRLLAEARDVLRHLKPGRLATLGVLGNHDYGRRWRNAKLADELTGIVEEAGVTVLRNACHVVQGLHVLGLDELWAGEFHPERLADELHASVARVVLCHNPDAVDRAGWGSFRGWILSGHTHGGQCKLPFFAPPILPVENPAYTAGEVDLRDGRMLYINRALGYLRRVRFNVRPEITRFTLKPA